MSIVCFSCIGTLYAPQKVWYAGTWYAWDVHWICDACVSRVPEDVRNPTDKQMEFQISFGELRAKTNDRGVYQMSGSRQSQIEFWVEPKVLEKWLPDGEDFLNRNYPYYCLDEYLRWLANGVRHGTVPSSGDRQKLLRDLTIIGCAVETFMLCPKGTDAKRGRYTPFDLEGLSDEQIELAEDLLVEILRRY